jgi:regulator of replication initiation timing
LDKNRVFAQVANVEERIGELYQELGSLRQRIVELLEENQRLAMENLRLRQQLHAKIADEAAVSGEGYENLVRLYEEGFHICKDYYGRLRTDQSEQGCLFCYKFLTRNHRE